VSSLVAPRRRPGSWPLRRLACVVAGVALVADALFLMSLGVFSLGVTLPFAIGCGLAAVGLLWVSLQRWLDRVAVRRRIWRGLWTAFGIWVLSVLLFWLGLARVAGASPADSPPPVAIIVLGSGTPAGKASPVLAARLDEGLAWARHFPQARVLVSGGMDFGESHSEGAIMGDYLRAKGLDPARIVQEERSTSTEENLLFSKALLHSLGDEATGPVVVVTSDFHVLRAKRIARHAGFTTVIAAGAPTPLYVRYNAWLREYFALASSFILGELA
jgi:uncharacterized SAM-binding protein YcdF (DUF218 family)